MQYDWIRQFLRSYFQHPDSSGLLPAVQNWMELTEELQRQGLLSFVVAAIQEDRVSVAVPSEVWVQWQIVFKMKALQSALLEQVAAATLQDLARMQIDAYLLKGPVYVDLIYGSHDIRPFNDIDLLIRQEDYPIVKSYLEGEGYTRYLGGEDAPACMEEQRESEFDEMHFVRYAGSQAFNVDVHWRLEGMWEGSPLKSLYPLENLAWTERAETSIVAGVAIPCLSLEMHLVQQVFHLILHHRLTGVRWLLDICLLLSKRGTDLDWPLIRRQLVTPEMEKCMGIILRLVQMNTGALPATIPTWQELWPTGSDNWEWRYYQKRLFSGGNRTGRYMTDLLLPVRWSDRFRMFCWVLFSPASVAQLRPWKDCWWLPMMQPFYIGYRFLSERFR